jgi:hypothetical protein
MTSSAQEFLGLFQAKCIPVRVQKMQRHKEKRHKEKRADFDSLKTEFAPGEVAADQPSEHATTQTRIEWIPIDQSGIRFKA